MNNGGLRNYVQRYRYVFCENKMLFTSNTRASRFTSDNSHPYHCLISNINRIVFHSIYYPACNLLTLSVKYVSCNSCLYIYMYISVLFIYSLRLQLFYIIVYFINLNTFTFVNNIIIRIFLL